MAARLSAIVRTHPTFQVSRDCRLQHKAFTHLAPDFVPPPQTSIPIRYRTRTCTCRRTK